MLKFELHIVPQVKQRPRFARGVVFTPKETAAFERAVKIMVRPLIGTNKPFSGPLKLTARFIFKRPKKPSHPYPSKGDTSNFLKAFEDACNGVIWIDDVQIVHVDARKLFDQSGGESRIEVEVEEVNA